MIKFITLTGTLFNGHAEAVPAAYYRQARASGVRVDWKQTDLPTIKSLVSLFTSAGLNVLLLVHNLEDCVAAKAAFLALYNTGKLQLEYKNEIDQPDMDPMDPGEYVELLNELTRREIKVWACAIGNWRTAAAYWMRLKAAGILQALRNHLGLSVHGYGYEPEALDDLAKGVHAEIGTIPWIISEYGPQPVLTDDTARAKWFARAIAAAKKLNICICLYRMPDPLRDGTGLITNNNGKTPYEPLPALSVLSALLGVSTATPAT